MIKREVFEAIPFPRFLFGFNKKAANGKGAHTTEDHMFCRFARLRGGYQSVIDHDASKMSIRHRGVIGFELTQEGENANEK